MSIKTTSVYIFLSIFILSISAQAEESNRRWSISAGAKTRRVEYSFDSRGVDNWQDYITPLQSRGSLNLCDGSGRVEYEDGYVDPGMVWLVLGIGYSGNTDLGEGSTGLVHFHSTAYGSLESNISRQHTTSNNRSVIPYLKARFQNINNMLGGEVGVSLLGAVRKESVEKETFIEQKITQSRTRYEFVYQGESDAEGSTDVIYDSDKASENPGSCNNVDINSSYPQRNVQSQDSVVVGTLNGLMDADVDIYWYELTLGLDWSKTLFNRLDLFALVGPTAHILDWEMEHNTTWTIAGDNSPATTTRANDSGTKTLVGGVAELGINLYLDADRRYFIEASGEYLYLEDVTLHAGAASVEIDPESWGGKLGIGMRL